MSPAVVRWVEATRAAQGLPRRVEDAQVLDEVAAAAAMTDAGPVERGGDGQAA